MDDDTKKLLENISTIEGYSNLPNEEQALIFNVINKFLQKKLSVNLASKRVAALFGGDSTLQDVSIAFKAFAMDLTMSEYKQKYIQVRKKGVWTDEEDKKLIEAINKLGTKNWQAVSDYVGTGRTKSQCSQRWERTLDPAISREEWTNEEKQRLIEAVQQYGLKSWVKVSKMVATRSDVQCRYKYYTSIAAHNKDDLYTEEHSFKLSPQFVSAEETMTKSLKTSRNKEKQKEKKPQDTNQPHKGTTMQSSSIFVEYTKQIYQKDKKDENEQHNNTDPFAFLDKMDFSDGFIPSIQF